MVKLKAFSRFENTTEALSAATALVESKLSKGRLWHHSMGSKAVASAQLAAEN